VGYKHAQQDGKSVYIDKRTGQFSEVHPNLKQGLLLVKALQKEQDQAAPDVPDGSMKASIMSFTRPNGTPYFYDFESSAECEAPESTIRDLPPHLLQQYGLETMPSKQVKQLKFYSWWFEDQESSDLTLRVSSATEAGGGLSKRYVTITFDIASCTFAIRVVSNEQELAVGQICSVTNVSGNIVDKWDLHVGAQLIILGRRVTLLKADLLTAQWADVHGRKLKALKGELLAEVQKYKPRSHKPAVSSDQVASGGLKLKHTIQQVQALIRDLRQYRPIKAIQFQARIAGYEAGSQQSDGTSHGPSPDTDGKAEVEVQQVDPPPPAGGAGLCEPQVGTELLLDSPSSVDPYEASFENDVRQGDSNGLGIPRKQ